MPRCLPAFILILAVLFTADATAQEKGRIFMKDGRILTPKSMRRQNDDIMAKFDRQQQNADGSITNIAGSEVEVGIKLAEIAKLDIPKPPILDAAPQALAEGKAEDLLKAMQPELDRFTGFRDAPGSWWVDLVPLQIQALLALKRDKEAMDAADSFSRLASDPENKAITRAFAAVARTRKGDHDIALNLYGEAVKTIRRHDILGMIAVNRGDSHLALAEKNKAENKMPEAIVHYEQALLNFTRIAALYPAQRAYLPQATLGAARSHFGLDDFDRAKLSIKELKDDFASTPEAAATDELAARVEKRQRLLSPANTPDPAATAPAAPTTEKKE